MNVNRRDFLKTTAGAAAGLALAAPFVHAAEKAPAKYKTALVGSGWWGMNILREAIAAGQSTVVGLCDVDTRALDKTGAEVEKLNGDKPARYADYRELIEKEKPDILINATPDHWHPLITIAAVKAGAHVYVEKPISHTVLEGRAMVKAARDAGKIVQVGTHRRISPHNVSGRDFIRSGKLGKVGMVRTFVHYAGGGPEQPQANEEAPKGLNWDMWCGPAPLRPFNRRIHPRGFRQFLDYANGQLGDWGIHWLDQVLWALDQKGPKKVFSTGGRPIKGKPVNDGAAQTSDSPDHQVVAYEFDDLTVTWEHRMFAGNNAEKGENVGCYFYGTEGTLHMGWQQGWRFYPVSGKEPIHTPPQLNQPDAQNIKELWADFLASIKSGKLPTSDIELGHRSTTMALLGMLSLKHGKSVAWDADKEEILGDPEASKLLTREYRKPWAYPSL